MLDSIYTGLTGLAGYSRGLSVVSNNVANLNTPGFKGAQLQFADLYYRDAPGGDSGATQIGAGLATGGTFLNFQTGEARDTGNDLDLMIDGPGLFVLRQEDDQLVYTRAGQFQFNADGVLVDRTNGARVATRDGAGTLSDITLNGMRFSPARPTATVELSGNLSTDDVQHVISNVTVYDSEGTARTLTLTFDSNTAVTPGSWNVRVALADASATEVGTGELRFALGRPDAAFSSVTLAYHPATGAAIDFTLHLSNDAVSTVAGADSSLQVLSQDGHASGSLVRTSFNADGRFVMSYSNGQTQEQGRLAMAWFTSPDQIEQLGNNLFRYRDGAVPQIGNPNAEGMGAIKGQAVELSNVDLAKQFSELIITQRGYQASSQVVTTANEMIQQLLDMRGKR